MHSVSPSFSYFLFYFGVLFMKIKKDSFLSVMEQAAWGRISAAYECFAKKVGASFGADEVIENYRVERREGFKIIWKSLALIVFVVCVSYLLTINNKAGAAICISMIGAVFCIAHFVQFLNSHISFGDSIGAGAETMLGMEAKFPRCYLTFEKVFNCTDWPELRSNVEHFNTKVQRELIISAIFVSMISRLSGRKPDLTYPEHGYLLDRFEAKHSAAADIGVSVALIAEYFPNDVEWSLPPIEMVAAIQNRLNL